MDLDNIENLNEKQILDIYNDVMEWNNSSLITYGPGESAAYCYSYMQATGQCK